jgi:hypothetical protein
MNNLFFYENGQGTVYDEDGNGAMDIDEEYDPFNTESLMTLSRHKSSGPYNLDPSNENLDIVMHDLEEKIRQERSTKKYNVYTDDQKALFVYFRKIKLLSAAVAGRRAGIVERTAQTWAKRLDNDPNWDIFEKETNKINRPKAQLREEHKHRLLEFFDEYPQATRNDAMDSLTEKFEGLDVKGSSFGSFILHECNLTVKTVTRHPAARNSDDNLIRRLKWVEKWSKTDIDFLSSCVFVDEAGFDINMRSSYARSARGTPAVVITPTTKAISHTVLGAISSVGVVSVEVRVPLTPKKNKG